MSKKDENKHDPKTNENLGKVECADCGRKVSVKINKGGLAYYNCFAGLDHREGYCGASKKWSMEGTAKIRRYFEKEKLRIEFEERKRAAQDANPTPPPEHKDQGATSFLGN